MSWMDALDAGIERAVLWRRRQRKRQEGRHDWWDDQWRVDRATKEGIRFSDAELVAMWQSGDPPPLSFNEAQRAFLLQESLPDDHSG